MTNIEKPRRSWRFRIGIAFLLAVIAGVLIYVFVPPLFTYEKLVIWSFMGWTTNSKGDIKQVTFIFWNNGTRTIAINGFWVNGTQLNSTDWISWRGTTLKMQEDTRICVIPKSFNFQVNATYNFTVDTTSGSHYYFPIKCDQTNIHPENLTIMGYEFAPGTFPHDPPFIGVRYKNYGATPIIITAFYLNNTKYEMLQWTWPNVIDYASIDYGWKSQKTYIIHIETIVGNVYEIVATAPSQ